MKNLEKNVLAVWGQEGQSWLNRLPDTIQSVAEYWGLSDIQAVPNMSYNYVAKGKQKIKPVVLKVSCDKELIESEYLALKHFNGIGSIAVLDKNEAWNALLLDQAIPGRSLKDIDAGKAIPHYAGIVRQLASIKKPGQSFEYAGKWAMAIDRISDPRIKREWLQKAKKLRNFLLNSTEPEYLCHGDLHFDNIIQHNDTWVSIDPKGVMGEMAFEAAAFDLPNKNIERCIDALANALNLNKSRLLGWIFLRIIISTQWFIEDNGDPSRMLNLAKKVYPLVTS